MEILRTDPTLIRFRLAVPVMAMIGNVGVLRQAVALHDGREPSYSLGVMLNWQVHIEGCMGEYCVAKYINRFWDGKIGDIRPGDIGPVEVRSAGATIQTKEHYDRIHERRLLLHDEDLDDKPYVSVTGINGLYLVHGWMFGKEGKLKEYIKDPTKKDRAAYFVPQNKLRDMADLKARVDNGDFD